MPSEWEEPLLPGQVPTTWQAEVETMGMLWEAGYDVLLETPFFEYFDQRDKPPRWPDWLTK